MKYERLTIRNEKGFATYNCSDEDRKDCELYYNCGECHKSTQVIKRLAELEDKIENGTLIELPCKVGDMVWTINCWQEYGKKELGERYIVTRYELHENKCSCIEINDKNYYRGEISIIAKESYKGVTPWVFLTREEAEKRLKELQNG